MMGEDDWLEMAYEDRTYIPDDDSNWDDDDWEEDEYDEGE